MAPLSSLQASKLSFLLLPLNPLTSDPEIKVTRTSLAAESHCLAHVCTRCHPGPPSLQQWLAHTQVQFPWFHPPGTVGPEWVLDLCMLGQVPLHIQASQPPTQAQLLQGTEATSRLDMVERTQPHCRGCRVGVGTNTLYVMVLECFRKN